MDRQHSFEDVAAHRLDRRRFVQTGAAAAALAALGPWPARAQASSGEVNVHAWPDYIWPEHVKAFESSTGIKLNLTTYGSNDELLSTLKATAGKGFDVIIPTVDNGPDWYASGDLLAPIDEKRIDVNAIIPSLWQKSKTLGAVNDGQRYMVPGFWGTEAVIFDSSRREYAYGELSYGDLWTDDNKGLVTVRPKSALISIGLHLDATGAVRSDRLLDTFKSEDAMRPVWDKIVAFAIEHKPWVHQFWDSTAEIMTAFQKQNCVIGQCWDGPSIRLMNKTNYKLRYLMPTEGGLAWLDTFAIPSGATHVEQAYAFINYMLTPEAGAIYAKHSGYNSAVNGVYALLSEANSKAFKEAYPDDSIENLWWWPPAPPWFIAARTAYVDKWNAA